MAEGGGLNKVVCPYEGCGAEFPTDRSLRAHIRAHQASSPFRCEHVGCAAVFATVSERDNHKATVHAEDYDGSGVVMRSNAGRKRRTSSGSQIIVDDSRFDDSLILNESHSKPTTDVADLFESDEIREIADNGAYFVSQIRDIQRRSVAVNSWNEADIRNLYQWAVWVQESVSDLNDDEWGKLDIALQKRRTKITGLKDSEKAMMYALLSDTNLKTDTVKHILKSVVETENNCEKHNVVLEVMKQCAQQKLDLNLYVKLRNSLLELCERDLVEESCATLNGIEAEAKGLLLARRIEKGLSSLRIRKPDSGDHYDAWGYILMWTAYFIDPNVKGGDGRDKLELKNVQENLNVLWCNAHHYAGTEVVWDMPADTMSSLCEKDVCIFDRYLSYLLSTLNDGGALAAESAKRVRRLAQTNGCKSDWDMLMD